MDDYNFLADLLNTFRLSNNWIKALAVIGLYATPISALALLTLPLRRKRRLVLQQPLHEVSPPSHFKDRLQT